MPLNFTTQGLWLYFPPEGSRATHFTALKNPSYSAGFNLANLGSNVKHDNQQTTEKL